MADSEPLRAATPEQVLEVVQASDELFMSTAEITEYFDATRPTVLNRLRTLEDESAVRSKDIGTSKAWYTPDRENYRLARFADDGGVSFGELQDLLDKYGAERLEQAIGILEEHDELDDTDIEVLRVAASALAQGRDPERVIKTLETPEVTPGWEQWVARVGLIALLSGGFALVYAVVSLSLNLGILGAQTALAVAVGGVFGGTITIVFALIVWNLRRVGRSINTQVLGLGLSEQGD